MKVDGKQYRTVWANELDGPLVKIINQTKLPFSFEIENLVELNDVINAIKEMHVRGAGCIGVTAAYGMWLAVRESGQDFSKYRALADRLLASRPTAKNLSWAVERQLKLVSENQFEDWASLTLKEAELISDEDATWCKQIGEHGKKILYDIGKHKKKGSPVNILTHCNAGWLAFADWGSATSPIYTANREGLPIHVWVDETRPLNQGSRLTSWELANEGVPHTIIPDNTGGHLMSSGLVDVVITGTDRTTSYGDVANKIGTYLKALAAKDNDIPFYVALPSSTFDWDAEEGGHDIPIEQRDPKEVMFIEGITEEGNLESVAPSLLSAKYANYAFDITPSRLITGLITERGICTADRDGIMDRFPERRIK